MLIDLSRLCGFYCVRELDLVDISRNLMLVAECTVLHWASQPATYVGFQTILGLSSSSYALLILLIT